MKWKKYRCLQNCKSHGNEAQTFWESRTDGNENESQAFRKGRTGEKKIQKEHGNRERDRKKDWRRMVIVLLLAVLIVLLGVLFLRSCRARDEPVPDTQRTYEESRIPVRDCPVPSEKNKRLNLALSDCYHISEEHPLFYMGFPEENIFDVVFIIKNTEGNVLYETDYVKPGTNVAIDGTAFLEKGDWQLDCLVCVFNHETGRMISDCTTIVLNVSYQ